MLRASDLLLIRTWTAATQRRIGDHYLITVQTPTDIDTPSKQHHSASEGYCVLVLDGTVPVAPARHFFGEYAAEDLTALDALLSECPWNIKIAASHFPTTAVARPQALRELFAVHGVVAHLSGHLHTLLSSVHPSLGHTMYSRNPGGTLELELGDFKTSLRFRVVAVDRGQVSFVDATFADRSGSNHSGHGGQANDIVALVTHPKDARFRTVHEPMRPLIQADESDAEVRLLAFASAGVASVAVSINDGPALHAKQDEVRPAIWRVAVPHAVLQTVINESGSSLLRIQAVVTDRTGQSHAADVRVDPLDEEIHPTTSSQLMQWFMARSLHGILVGSSILLLVLFVGVGYLPVQCGPRCGLCPPNVRAAVDVSLGSAANTRTRTQGLLWRCTAPFVCLQAQSRFFWRLHWITIAWIAVGPWYFGEMVRGEYGLTTSWAIITTQYVVVRTRTAVTCWPIRFLLLDWFSELCSLCLPHHRCVVHICLTGASCLTMMERSTCSFC